MKVSVNWIRHYNSLYKSSADPMPSGIDDLVEKIGAQLGAVDEVIDLGKKYQEIRVVKVVSCTKHPNADKLSICLIDDNKTHKKVKRDKDNLVQVVCGAANVKAGMLAAWIPPGAIVPSTFDKEPFVIKAREIRGQMSSGMLASPKELAFGESHEGILEIDENIKPGAGFAEVFGLDDYIVDIENKMFTHRPDLFGHLGIARELAGIQGYSYKSPDWYKTDALVPSSNAQNSLSVKVKNEIPELVSRFLVLPIKDVKVGPSPVWLQARLASIGVRPINNIVDLTNYYMFLTAQPLHAYDYDKVKAQDPGADRATLIVRRSKKGEYLTLLGAKNIKLEKEAIIIATQTKAIGLGGIMGGASTEVDENTRNIILECGTFDMNTTRRSSMFYGLFTEAATRFTKGQSPLQNQAVIAKTAGDILHLAGGRISGELIDANQPEPTTTKHGYMHKPIAVSEEFINVRLGLKLTGKEIKQILENVEFNVSLKTNHLTVKAPFWRTDIEIAEDIVEEIGRLYGYDKLSLELPKRDLEPAGTNHQLEFKSRLREALTRAGANEVLTYSFVHANLLKKARQDESLAYKIANALSPDLHYYRLSLTPSLLDKVHPNIKLGFSEFALYEINKTHNKKHFDLQDPNLPREFNELALVFTSSEKARKASGAPYYQARKMLDFLGHELGISFDYAPIDKELGSNFFVTKPFDYKRTAKVSDKKTKQPIGFIGEYAQDVLQKFKLPSFTAGFELDVDLLQKAAKLHQDYKPLNRFPTLEQDFNLRTSVEVSYAELENFLDKQFKEAAKEQGYIYQLSALDIFQRQNDLTHKQTTWRIVLAHPERTLTTAETNKLLDKIAQKAKSQIRAERV